MAEIVYMSPNLNQPIEEEYVDLIVAMFQRAIDDCDLVIRGSEMWTHKDMTLKDKEKDLDKIFKEVKRCGLLDYITENSEQFIQIARKEVMDKFREYAENHKDETYKELVFANS